MNNSLSQSITDSENGYLNSTYWKIDPVFKAIQNGDTEALKKAYNLKAEQFSFDDRLGTNEKKYYEYMLVSLINTFMIAAIFGGVYPPKANSVADSALHRLSVMHGFEKAEQLIRETAETFCLLTARSKSGKIGNAHIQKAVHYINTRLTQEITVEDIAKEVKISKYHFMRLFKLCTGKTVSGYLLSERLNAAAQYLISTDKSISEIASLFRFCDQSYFTYTFKKQFGVTPAR